MTTALQLRQVSKVYGEGPTEVQALREVDLSVHSGELVTVMGPSGSGKSTLLTIAGSLEEPTSGDVLVAGSQLSDTALPLELDGVSAKAARPVGLAALAELGLADQAARYPDELSGGGTPAGRDRPRGGG